MVRETREPFYDEMTATAEMYEDRNRTMDMRMKGKKLKIKTYEVIKAEYFGEMIKVKAISPSRRTSHTIELVSTSEVREVLRAWELHVERYYDDQEGEA
jgi:hypothetical protein